MPDVSGIVALLDKHLPKSALERLGMSPEAVRRQAALAALAAHPKGRTGRPHPEHVVRAMFADYVRLGSTERVGHLYGGRSATAIQSIFRHHGLPRFKGSRRPTRVHRGCVYFQDSKGTYRKTTMIGEQRSITFLHRVIWEEIHGAIPTGFQVTFADGDRENFAPANLVCLPLAEVASRNRRRALSRRVVA